MAKAKKLPSGNWRVQVYSHTDADDKRHYESFTASTKKEAELMAAEFAAKKGFIPQSDLTFEKAAEKYISIKSNVLSPSTIHGYRSIAKNYFEGINGIKLSRITDSDLQSLINDLSDNKSSKTVKNIYGFITAVYAQFEPGRKISIRLPQKIRQEIVVPSDDEIQAILTAAKANLDLYIPICLSAFGSLRRSEICALNPEKDITEKGVLIRGARVISDKGKFITKNTTKNVTSRREAYLPAALISLIKEVGYITKYQPNSLSAEFRKLLERNNIRHMRFHDLRHYWVSTAIAQGMPDHYIMRNGGWATMDTVRSVYAHIMKDKNDQHADILNKHFENVYSLE